MKTIKIFDLIAVLVLIFSFSKNMNAQTGNSTQQQVTIKERSISSFSEIEINGGFNIILIQSDKEDIKIETRNDFHSSIETYVNNGVLKLKVNDNFSVLKSYPVKVYIYFRDLKRLDLNGALRVSCEDMIFADELFLNISGACDVEMNLDANRLKANFNGVAGVRLSGKTDEFKLEFAGVGDLKAFDFISQTADIEIAGAGKAQLNVTKKLKARVSGIGSVVYKGDPDKVVGDINFLGELKQFD